MRHRPLAIALLVLTASAVPATAGNWPRFRGPNGSGVSPTRFPAEWTDDAYAWTRPLPGRGNGSPAVWGDRLFVTSADAEKERRFLFCLDAADGAIRWRRRFPLTEWDQHGLSTYANTTPAADGERVYLLWQGPKRTTLHAFTHEGKRVWKKKLPPFKAAFGGGVSPIVFRDKVFVPHDSNGASYLFAFHADSGELAWKVPRKGRKRDCFPTPCIYRPADRPQVVFSHCYRGLTAHDPSTGRKLWQIRPFGTFGQRALASPIVHNDLVIATSGHVSGRRRLVAVRAVPPDDAEQAPDDSGSEAPPMEAREVYRLTKRVPYLPTPLVYEGRLYLWGDDGVVTCREAGTGDVVWQERVGGSYFASPVCADGRLYNVDRNGRVRVIAAGPSFEKLGEVHLGERALATPSIGHGLLLFRTQKRIHALPAVDGAR